MQNFETEVAENPTLGELRLDQRDNQPDPAHCN